MNKSHFCIFDFLILPNILPEDTDAIALSDGIV